VITVDKNAASLKAFNELQAQGAIANSCELRQVKYLNNIVDQDHRFSKRCLKAGLGFFSFETPWNMLQGDEVMNMVRKGQVHGVEKGNITDQVAFIARLLRVAASAEQEVSLHAQCVPPRVFATEPKIREFLLSGRWQLP
jgi:hypothetical protein